jgi:cell division GTPase FtsZ
MRLALVGVGQAGGKIVDEFIRFQDRSRGNYIAAAAAVNTARADLVGLEEVPESQRTLIGGPRVKGHGVGADNELGATVARESRSEVLGALDAIPASQVEAFLVVAALGGGTGSGAGPVIAEYLREIYQEPVYGLGILPAANEGGIYTLNAARSLKTFVEHVDNLLLFDNEAWRKSGQTLTDSYDEINGEIARRFGTLFNAGEVDPRDTVAESIVDTSEIINTLSVTGVSTVGYATERIQSERGLLSRFRNGEEPFDDADQANRVASLVRQATLGRLTIPCELESTKRVLTVIAGPQHYLNRQGIEHARNWLEDQTGSREVRGGDYPVSGDSVAAVVLLSGVTDVPRVKKLQRGAVEAQDRTDELQQEHDRELEELLTDEHDELDSLF